MPRNQGVKLGNFHFWNLEQSSAEKAGIDPTYQAPFQEVVTSPLPGNSRAFSRTALKRRTDLA
jgi:hypothetical protein